MRQLPGVNLLSREGNSQTGDRMPHDLCFYEDVTARHRKAELHPDQANTVYNGLCLARIYQLNLPWPRLSRRTDYEQPSTD